METEMNGTSAMCTFSNVYFLRESDDECISIKSNKNEQNTQKELCELCLSGPIAPDMISD